MRIIEHIPHHPHLAVAKLASPTDLVNGVRGEILAQTTSTLATIHIALQMHLEEGGGGPNSREIMNVIWGAFRQLEVAAQLFRELPEREASEAVSHQKWKVQP